MHKSKRKWLCVDCDEHTKYEHYFVNNEVWFKEARMSEEGMLCVGCLETRINRILTPQDFTDAHINNPKLYSMSNRLLSRIRGN
jgi:hypothetical protein